MYIMKRFLGEDFERFNSIINKYNLEQNTYINLTACVSYPFQEVLDVQGMPLATVPTEGTRGKRYFPSVESIDDIENYAEELCLELFHSKIPHIKSVSNQIPVLKQTKLYIMPF